MAPASTALRELAEVSLEQLAAELESGKTTSVELVTGYLARIDAIDRHGASLHAVIELNPDALAAAQALDRERAEKGSRGPLHGIPILLKDNVATADHMETTAGSLALLGAKSRQDAFVVERLRAAGAVLLGKTNLSEWANFRGDRASSGWSARGGQTKNPYVLDRSPCGSSSGTGAAVAASLAAAGVGTETDGSIMCPSSMNGLVGIKPTVGLVSRGGIIPVSVSQDSAGPMARSVRDAAILLGAMIGNDPRDPATATSKGKTTSAYTRGFEHASLLGARIGVAKKYVPPGAEVGALAERAIAAMMAEGAVIVDDVAVPAANAFEDKETELLLSEFKDGINGYLAQLDGSPVHDLAALIAFDIAHRDRELAFFGQELFEKAQAKAPLSKDAYRKLRTELQVAAQNGIDKPMDKDQLDAIVSITAGPAWLIDHLNGDFYTGGNTSLAAVAGYPSITVPAGQVSGLPIGISFFGHAFSEEKLLGLAYAFERATKLRAPPRYLPTLTKP